MGEAELREARSSRGGAAEVFSFKHNQAKANNSQAPAPDLIPFVGFDR